MTRQEERYKSCKYYKAGNCDLSVRGRSICKELKGKLDVEIYRKCDTYAVCGHYMINR